MIETTIKLNEKEVKVQATWYYPQKHLTIENQRDVFCRISILTNKLNDKGNRKWELFSEGHARRNKKDKFNKSFGRKVSFTKAVNSIKEKEIRAILWEAFIRKFGTN